MIYQPIKLDRDLFVDRTKVVQPDSLILKHPDEIRIQATHLFIIENFNPRDKYEVSFSAGTWIHNQDTIQFTTPDDYAGPLKLTITQTKAPFQGFTIFEDGTVYTEDGTVDRAERTEDGRWVYDYQYCDYEIDSQIDSNIGSPKLPIPVTKIHSKTNDIGAFSPSTLFGDLGSAKLNKDLSKFKKGNISDYFLPSELNSAPDDRKYLYKVEDGKFISIPRNSNVTESGGDVFSGYRKPGDVGGSLTVFKGPDRLKRTFEWDLEILLDDLEAVLPDEIMALCLTSVEIRPVLRGLATGHTFWWEQIKGDESSVTWLTPRNQKDVVIDLGGNKTDRTFRFWISKGTRYAKYYDVQLYGTPAEKIYNAVQPGWAKAAHQNHLNIKVHECSPILLSYENIWNKQLRINVVRNY